MMTTWQLALALFGVLIGTMLLYTAILLTAAWVGWFTELAFPLDHPSPLRVALQRELGHWRWLAPPSMRPRRTVRRGPAR